MKQPEIILNTIQSQGIIPLFYHDELSVSVNVVNVLYNAGVRVIEYTNRGITALENFKVLLKIRDERWSELILGIGTIKFVEQAKDFVNAGADFIICPGVITEVAKVVHDAGLLWVPGCMTSTEIIIAEQSGAKLIKLFPGSLLGPSYISALKEIFPNLMFMPTGGVEVNEENINAWFKTGVVAVGLGSKVISKELMQQKDYITMGNLAKKALQIVQSIKR